MIRPPQIPLSGGERLLLIAYAACSPAAVVLCPIGVLAVAGALLALVGWLELKGLARERVSG